MSLSNKISFHYQVAPFKFLNRTALKMFLLTQFEAVGRDVEHINYVFCDDAFLLSLNQSYLKHNTLTDIISFELSAKSAPLLGDIYISIPRIRDNAAVFHSTFTHELHRVIFHGSLHFLGYKDKSNTDASTMRAKEDEWLDGYFVPRGTRQV